MTLLRFPCLQDLWHAGKAYFMYVFTVIQSCERP